MAKQVFLNTYRNQLSSPYTEQGNINLVWKELERRFGFPPKQWHAKFVAYCDSGHRDRINGFYDFGEEIINPVLNEILCRKSDYPTFQKLVEYVRKNGGKGGQV